MSCFFIGYHILLTVALQSSTLQACLNCLNNMARLSFSPTQKKEYPLRPLLLLVLAFRLSVKAFDENREASNDATTIQMT